MSEKNTASRAHEESYYLASQWQLMWRKFRRHHLALVGGVILGLLYLAALGADFLAPYDPNELYDHIHHPPSRIRFLHEGRLVGPFVYGVTETFDREAYQSVYTEDRSVRYRVRLFVRDAPYRFAGLLPSRLHLLGADDPGKCSCSAPTRSAATCSRAPSTPPASPSPSGWWASPCRS